METPRVAVADAREPSARGIPERTLRALGLLAGAVLLGALGERLLRLPPGVGIPLWVGALLLVLALLGRLHGTALRGEGRWLFAPALLFAAALAWRASPALAALNLLAVLFLLGLGALRARAGRWRAAGVAEFMFAPFSAAFQVLTGPLVLGMRDVRWRDVARGTRSERAASVLRGLLLAAPLLFVFGALFAAADPVFASLLSGLFGWSLEDFFATLGWSLFWAWLAAGHLRMALLGSPGELPFGRPARERAPAAPWSLPPLEAAVVLVLLNALFLAFVLVQFRYLFGGAGQVQAVAGMSYAEYARRGFFELVTVAALVLPVLLSLDALVADQGGSRPRAVRALSAGLITLLLVVIASAVQRMLLYQSAYGLTEQRFYSSAFMGWLTLVFLWFAATVLRARRERFAWGALLAGLGVLALLNALNPDATIARVNLARAEATGRLDAGYLSRLGADATPVLLAALPGLDREAACPVVLDLLGRADRPHEWPSWNWSRAREQRLLRARAQALAAMRCDVRRPAARTRAREPEGRGREFAPPAPVGW